MDLSFVLCYFFFFPYLFFCRLLWFSMYCVFCADARSINIHTYILQLYIQVHKSSYGVLLILESAHHILLPCQVVLRCMFNELFNIEDGSWDIAKASNICLLYVLFGCEQPYSRYEQSMRIWEITENTVFNPSILKASFGNCCLERWYFWQ